MKLAALDALLLLGGLRLGIDVKLMTGLALIFASELREWTGCDGASVRTADHYA